MSKEEYRIGVGRDIHRLVAGRQFVVGGVVLPAERGEAGHSDGDALLHAIIDALLGAAHAGDIGERFPDTDPKWKNARSTDLLTRVWRDLHAAGWNLVNLDCIVSCEYPKILPARNAIIASIATLLDAPTERVFVKGKTAEGLDAVGLGDAIETIAVCLLARDVV
jgi:2-C-methyl-D-erythritol 2,4-cyclodiphosphate synthase